MVGKAKRPRLHRTAPRAWPARDLPPLPAPEPGPGPGKDWDFSSSDVFSGLKIDPDTLVKKLDLDSRSIISSRTEIESVKIMKQKQKAEAKRKATPVVGDMQPLMEALPELSDLTTGGRGRKPVKSHIAKAEPSDFCLMKQAQKHRLLEEEVARFHEVITDPKYRANPLMAISNHLSKRLRLGEEGNPF
ncbi:protein FAM207A isoform X1 [Corapipo altera]|uniref:protein FAM207A isoform X1 n=1 Tax=Corapipo altera TaxID=415028 RepID=UPI000FD684CD|nr:protein FAM207A isoform X1 [Corapipo altera]